MLNPAPLSEHLLFARIAIQQPRKQYEVTNQEYLTHAHANLREYKHHLWHHHGVRDMNPRALVLTRTGNAIPMGGKCDEPGAPSMPEILGGILGTMTEERRSVLESIALALDGYYVDMDANPDVKHLEKDFQTNPASAVKQSIMTVVATDDRCGGFDMDAVTQTYTIADGGVIEWGEELATLDIGFIGPFLVRIFGKEGL